MRISTYLASRQTSCPPDIALEAFRIVATTPVPAHFSLRMGCRSRAWIWGSLSVQMKVVQDAQLHVLAPIWGEVGQVRVVGNDRSFPVDFSVWRVFRQYERQSHSAILAKNGQFVKVIPNTPGASSTERRCRPEDRT